MNIIEISNLNKNSILSGINLNIKEGDYLAIVGPNGGGKTTLIRTILGLENFDSGEIKLFSKSLSEFKDWDRVGYVPQRATNIDVAFPATVDEILDLSPSEQKYRFEIMDMLDIYRLKNRLIGELSGGERQKVIIARAILKKPDILFLDEPYSGVDVVSQEKFYNFLKFINSNQKSAILLITHDISAISHDVRSVAFINKTLTLHQKECFLNIECKC